MRPSSARYRWIIACSAPGVSGSRVLDGGGSVGSTTPSGVDRSTAMLLCNLALLSRAHRHPELCPRHPELCPCHPELCPWHPELALVIPSLRGISCCQPELGPGCRN